ncbi:50S ribosomal protein L19e [Candidatus Bathyarchaeota archaeon]|nr:50S ribosomal protein L19e [Candidatus Bathyarchaeota archaeon]NIU81030.1 50S ribosomal protein L19e [Candidatus Bathyarchaeota archaeon]NIV67688.1 50S ribosomal protein L19e [Candidatus Bathyarchaeota archaeon]NIW16673.1 50S ribosomal protein L19e [Candidatus Bathyarchaeota archaeon]NIW34887.1 50S ribosomal protein L19e [Candidatus Bathyarchaeota archaeon]
MSLKNQRRLAAEILKVGQNRVWIDPDRIADVEIAITREEIRRLIHEGAIQRRPQKGVSRARARSLHQKRKKGLRRGPGQRSGSKRARIPKKKTWMKRIRVLRKRLRELKANHTITESVYRHLYKMAGSGEFESVADLERYIQSRGLGRRR